jgi:hypothetical protein
LVENPITNGINGMLTTVGKPATAGTLATAGMPTKEGRPSTAKTTETLESLVTEETSTSV